MIPDDLEALALADAIGALDADERVTLDARVALLTPEQQEHVASLYDVALALGSSVDQVEPPPHVRSAVIAATRGPSRYTLYADDQDFGAVHRRNFTMIRAGVGVVKITGMQNAAVDDDGPPYDIALFRT